MNNNITTASVIENGISPYALSIMVSGHELRGDEPVSLGGDNSGPAPYDLLTAALGECTAMTIRWYAVQQKWPLVKVSATVTHHKDSIDGQQTKRDIFKKIIVIEGHDLTEEQRQKLFEVAAKCPIQRTLESHPIIETMAATEI